MPIDRSSIASVSTQSFHAPKGTTVINADKMGPQLHVGSPELSAARFQPPGALRTTNQVAGGLWTAALLPDGGSSYTQQLAWPLRKPGLAWWLLEPDPAAGVLVIDSAQDFAAARGHFPHPIGDGLDYITIARFGLSAVFVTEQGSNLPRIGPWGHASTFWARWAFLGDPVRLDPPAGFEPLPPVWALPADAPAPLEGTQRYPVEGWGVPDGFFIDVRPDLSEGGKARARHLLRERAEVMRGGRLSGRLRATIDDLPAVYPNDGHPSRVIGFLVDALFATVMDDQVLRHNLTDERGVPFPVGAGLGVEMLTRRRMLFMAVVDALRDA